MTLFEEFKQSLKAIEAEEIFDLIIYRPIAFIFVKIVYGTNLTPNQTSVIAMIMGVTAGVAFGFGTITSTALGGGFYLACNVLDCADGQIARLKKNGTKVGRIVDGFIDYVVAIATFLGIAIGMTHMQGNSSLHFIGNVFELNSYAYIWIITFLAGISSAHQAFYFDFYRNKYMEIVYGKVYSLEDELAEFEEEKKRIQREPDKAGFMDNFLISIYLKYTKLQLTSQKKKVTHADVKISPERYKAKNKLLLRILSYTGSTTHISFCIIYAFINKMEIFLLVCILPLNIIMLVIYFIQRRIYNKLISEAQASAK